MDTLEAVVPALINAHCLNKTVTQRWGGNRVGGATVWFVNRQEGLDPNAGRVAPCY